MFGAHFAQEFFRTAGWCPRNAPREGTRPTATKAADSALPMGGCVEGDSSTPRRGDGDLQSIDVRGREPHAPPAGGAQPDGHDGAWPSEPGRAVTIVG